MAGAKGYGFVSSEEENWDELTYAEQQAIIEEEKKKALKALDEIEKSEYKTQSDVATYLQTESILKGKPDTYAGLDAERTIELGAALGHPMASEVFEPTPMDIAGTKGRELWNRLTVDMPAFIRLGMRDKKGADEYTAAEEINIANDYLKRNPNASVDETRFAVMQAKKTGADFDGLIIKEFKDAEIAADNHIKNNAKARAVQEWTSTELQHPFREGEVGKWALNIGLDAVSSQVMNRAAGIGGSLALGWMGKLGGPKGIAAGGFAGYILGSSSSGAILEGGSYLREEWSKRTQDKEISPQEYLSKLSEARETYAEEIKKNPKSSQGKVFNEDLQKTVNADMLADLYDRTNFFKTPDGKIIMRGLSNAESLEAVAPSAYTYAAISGLVENISMLKYIADLSPALKNAFPKILRSNAISKTVDKIEAKARLIPKKSLKGMSAAEILVEGVRRTQRAAGELGPNGLIEAAAEGVEEVTQGAANAVVASYGPKALDDIRYYDTTPREEHGGWTQLRDEFAGGVIGSSPITFIDAGKSITGFTDRMINKDILKKAKTTEGYRFGVEKEINDDGQVEYVVHGYSTREEDDGTIVSEKEPEENYQNKANINTKLADKDGKSLQRRFDNFQDAFNVAQTYNEQELINTNTINAWRYKDIIKGTTKVVENDDGSFSVEVYDNDGNIFKKDEETYKKKWKANRRKKRLDLTIDEISKNFKRYGLDKPEDNEVIKSYNRHLEANEDLFKGYDKDVKEEDTNDITMGYKAFFLDDVKYSDPGAQQKFTDLSDTIFESPDDIINIAKQDTDNIILRKTGHEPEQLLRLFDDTFGPDAEDIPNFTEKREELNKALYPEGAPKNQNKGPEPTIEGEGPPLTVTPSEFGPEPTIEEGPPGQEVLFEEGPEDIAPPTETERKTPPKSKKLADVDIKEVKKNIAQLEAEIPLLEEGTGKRTFAEKRLSMLQKEVERREVDEKKAPAKKAPSLKDIIDDVAKIIGVMQSPDPEQSLIKLVKEGQEQEAIDDMKTWLTNPTVKKDSSFVIEAAIEILEKKKAPKKKKLPLESVDPFGTGEAIEGLTPKEEKINQTLDVAERLFKTFEGQINLEAKGLGVREPVAKYDPNTNTVILNLDSPDLDIDAPFHEFSHPFISMIAKDNLELFNSIYEEAIAANETLLEDIKFTYRQDIMDGSLDEQGVKEEVIAHAIDQLSKKTYQELEALNKKNPLRKLWTAIKRFFNYIMDKYGIKNFDNAYNLLTPSTTLKEISDILINYDNKYIIDMGSKAFQDEAIEIATNENDVAGVEVVESVTEAAIVSEQNALVDAIEGEMAFVKNQKDLDKAISKILKIGEKRFPVRTKKYTGTAIQKSINSRLGLETNASASEVSRFIGKIKSRVLQGLPPTLNINKKHIDKLISLNAHMGGEIEFRYRFVENEKLKDPNGNSNIKDLHTWPGIRKGEKENIKEFAKTIKVNSMKNIDIINAYINYTNKKLGLSYITSKTWSEALGYSQIFYGDTRPDVHRVLIVRKKVYTGALHSFEELKTPQEKSTFQRDGGGPLGWYTVAYKDNKVVLHEFQSDVLMETLKVIERAKLNKGEVTLKKGKPIPNLFNMLSKDSIESNAVMSNISQERKYTKDPIDAWFAKKNVKVQVGFKKSLFEGIPYDFNLSEYTFDNVPLDYKQNPSIILDMFIKKLKQDMSKTMLVQGLTEPIKEEHVRLIIDRLIDLDKYTEYSKPKIDNFDSIDMFNAELNHSISSLNGQTYSEFQALKITKYMHEIISGYGEKGHTNQERVDFLEFFNFYYTYNKEEQTTASFNILNNSTFLTGFPNKDNSFYRFLLVLDNEQRSPEYSKPQFEYNHRAIYDSLRFLSYEISEYFDNGDLKNIITRSGKIKKRFEEDLKGVFFNKYKKAGQDLHSYIQEYYMDRTKLQTYTNMQKVAKEATPVFLDEVLKRFQYYTREYVRKLGTVALASDFANSKANPDLNKTYGDNNVVDMADIINNIPELKNAQKEMSITDNWFENLIMHSIKHAHVTKPGKDIYINTASAISLIEGTDSPFAVYASKRENQWRNLHFSVNSISPFYEDLNNRWVDEDVQALEENLREIYSNDIQLWYSKNKKDFDNPEMVVSVIDSLKTTGSENSYYGYNPNWRYSKQILRGDKISYSKTISEIQDKIIDYLMNESKNSAFWNYTMNNNPTLKNKDSFIGWGNHSVMLNLGTYDRIRESHNLTRLRGLVPIERKRIIEEYNKTIKDTIDKEFSKESKAIKTYLYNQHAIFDRPVTDGVFKKALNKVHKDKLTGVEIELAHPEGSSVPMYKVKITNDKKLVPVKWKKKLETIQNAKDLPQSLESLEVNLTNRIKLEELNERSEEYKVMEAFFNDAWSHTQRISGKGKKVDIKEFKDAMNNIIDEQLVPAFEKWWESKFEHQMDKPDRVRSIGETRYTFINKEDISTEIVPSYNDWAEGESVKQMLDRGVTNEKVLSLNDIVYFKALKRSITEKQLDTMYKTKHRFKNYEDWKSFVKRKLNITFKLTSAQNEELHKFWNRIKYSTIRTNRDGESSTNQRDNFVVKVTTKFDPQTRQWKLVKLGVKLKGEENVVTGNQNNQNEKITLFEKQMSSVGGRKLFSFISGGDVLGNYAKRDNEGELIRVGPRREVLEGWKPKYGFFNFEELNRLESYLRAMNYTIAFVRGDSDKLGIVEITDDHKNNAKLADAKLYWEREFDAIARTPEEKQKLMKNLPDYLSGDIIDRASSIAIHEALTMVFPNYLLDPKGGSNVYKRLKLPFTPVTISDEMPPIRAIRFDPDNVKFRVRREPWMLESDKEFIEYDAMQAVPGLGDIYIGDGNTLTSQAMFDLFHKHHGLAKTTAKAKTVIYGQDSTGAVAIKHQHVLPKRHMQILDSNTNEVLFTVDNNRNITDKDGNIVHMLATDDEIKIGDKFRFTDEIEINGNEIGFTKYDETSKIEVKHIMQWYNYVQDPAVLSQFMKIYGPELGERVRDSLMKGIEGEKLLSSEGIRKFLDKHSGKDNVGFASTAKELADLGAGVHPSMQHVINVLIQTQSLGPALNLDKSKGSIYDVSMDVTGQIEEGEIGLAVHNSDALKEKIAKAVGTTKKKLTIAEANKYLSKNKVYVMVTRSPVAYAGGAYMARVRYLHSRRSLADLNVIDLRLKLEGDGDGDEVHIELLDDETTSIYKNYMDTIKSTPLNLNRFVSKKQRSISTRLGRIDTMSSLIAGQTAIAEIANITAYYGMLYKTFESFDIMGGGVLKLKKPTDKMDFPEAFYDGKQGAWKGNVEEYLRIWLQAAVDNNEYGLLYDWDYSQNKILFNLFENPELAMRNQDSIMPIIEYYKDVLSIRRGYNFKKGNFRLSDTLEISQNVYQQALDRSSFDIIGNVGDVIFKANVKNPQLTPYELIAVAPYRLWQRISRENEMIGFDNTPYAVQDNVHRHAHQYAREFLESASFDLWTNAKEMDLENGVWDGLNEKEYLQNEVIKGRFYITGKSGEPGMGRSLYRMLADLKELGPQTIDRNDDFINWKNNWNEKFAGLSQVAKVAATLSFLRGYLTVNQRLDMIKGTQHPKVFPPVSKKSSEISLLDAGMIEKFFEKYHEYLNKRDERSLDKLIENSSEHVSLIKSVMEVCK